MQVALTCTLVVTISYSINRFGHILKTLFVHTRGNWAAACKVCTCVPATSFTVVSVNAARKGD